MNTAAHSLERVGPVPTGHTQTMSVAIGRWEPALRLTTMACSERIKKAIPNEMAFGVAFFYLTGLGSVWRSDVVIVAAYCNSDDSTDQTQDTQASSTAAQKASESAKSARSAAASAAGVSAEVIATAAS